MRSIPKRDYATGDIRVCSLQHEEYRDEKPNGGDASENVQISRSRLCSTRELFRSEISKNTASKCTETKNQYLTKPVS